MATTRSTGPWAPAASASAARVAVTVVLHGLAIWGLCGATIGLAMATMSQQDALLVHAAAAPVIASLVSLVYFRRHDHTTPLVTACCFLAVVVLADVLLVAMIIYRSFEMFRSAIGTWLPFGLIFAATWVVGAVLRHRSPES